MDVFELLHKLAVCVEKGKADRNSPYPPELKDQDGAAELTLQALQMSIPAKQILAEGLMPGMHRVGDRFGAGKAYIPDLLIAARAMNAALQHLKSAFDKGEVTHKGTVILGTVAGDLHDIGKNIVRMVLQGDGWQVIDLGVDVETDRFLAMANAHPDAIMGLSALLTTTMVHMEQTVQALREVFPDRRIYVGGAPLSQAFSDQIHASGYFPDPYTFMRHLNEQVGKKP